MPIAIMWVYRKWYKGIATFLIDSAIDWDFRNVSDRQSMINKIL